VNSSWTPVLPSPPGEFVTSTFLVWTTGSGGEQLLETILIALKNTDAAIADAFSSGQGTPSFPGLSMVQNKVRWTVDGAAA
jgi:hypothetical protein